MIRLSPQVKAAVATVATTEAVAAGAPAAHLAEAIELAFQAAGRGLRRPERPPRATSRIAAEA